MKQRILGIAILGFCMGQSAWADLLMRYTIDFKFGSFLPAVATDAMKKQMDELPRETGVLVKGDRVLTTMGRIVMLTDSAKGTITVMDTKAQRFAVSPLASYGEKIAAAQKLPPMPAQVQAMFDNMKFDVKTEHTGQTATIRGIRGEETLLTLGLEAPSPMGPAMQIKMELHQWMATAEAVSSIPGLKEMAAYTRMPKTGMDPTEQMTRAMASFPGLADKLRGPMDELKKNSGGALLRMKASVFMPSMAQMTGSPDQPFTEYTMELAELSYAPLADSQFEVPAGYQTASMEDLIGVLFPAPKTMVAPPPGPPRQETPAAGPRPPMPPLPPGVYRVGNGVTPPQIIWQEQPTYTEEARAARISGSVLLYVEVGADGTPQKVRVLRSLDPGLDQKAVDKVSTWKFKPGMKDGNPVAVAAQIEVNFRLL